MLEHLVSVDHIDILFTFQSREPVAREPVGVLPPVHSRRVAIRQHVRRDDRLRHLEGPQAQGHGSRGSPRMGGPQARPCPHTVAPPRPRSQRELLEHNRRSTRRPRSPWPRRRLKHIYKAAGDAGRSDKTKYGRRREPVARAAEARASSGPPGYGRGGGKGGHTHTHTHTHHSGSSASRSPMVHHRWRQQYPCLTR